MPRDNPVSTLREAAQRLRDVAPQITGPLQGLADPVADWLDQAARTADWAHDLFADSKDSGEFVQPFALAVARTVLGEEAP